MTKIANIIPDRLYKAWEKRLSLPNPSAVASLFPKRKLTAIKGFASRLDTVSDALDAICSEAEPSFIALGEGLQDVHSEITNVMHRIKNALEEFESDSDNSILRHIEAVSESSFLQMRACHAGITDKLEHIKSMSDSLGNLLKKCPEIEKQALLLRVVGLNIGIESARSSGATELFQLVAEDVTSLSNEMSEQAEISQRDLMDSQNIQSKALKNIGEGLADFRNLARKAKAAVDKASVEIRKIITISMETLQEADRRSHLISSEVGEVVVSLQFHDNMSQRIAHTVEALQDAKNLFSDAAKDRQKRSKALWGSTHSIVQLQMAQLHGVSQQIRTTHAAQEKALLQIAQEVTNLKDHLIRLAGEEGEAAETTGQGPFEGLQNALQDLYSLLGKEDSLASRMEDTAESASRTAERIMECVTDISGIAYRLRIIALNSIVRASQLNGGGDTLDVLSQEIQRLSYVTGEVVERMDSVLDGLRSNAAALKSEVQVSDALGEKTETGGDPDNATERVTRAWQRFREESAQAIARCKSLETVLGGMLEKLDFLPPLAANLETQSAELEAVITSLSTRATPEDIQEAHHTARLSERYTMETERDTHRDFLEEIPASDGELVPAGGIAGSMEAELFEETDGEEPAGEKDDFGDNVELF